MCAEEKAIVEMLYKKYQKLVLCKKECSIEVNRSCSSLDRDRKNGTGMQYIKNDNGNIYYPISEIARFVVYSVKKTI